MYTAITNFRYGLDSRRSELSSMPGSLLEALDGHITQGGEFEKRKAFVKTALPAGVIGFQPTSQGIYVFGTAATVATTAPIIYQQILHPKTLAGLGAVALTSIVSSTQINDAPFVCALWADDSTFCYYNGVLVSDFTNGLVASYLTTNAQVCANMTTAINAAAQYTAVQDTGTLAHETDAFSLPGNSYTASIAVASTANITVSSTSSADFTGANVYATGTGQKNAVDGSVLTIGSRVYQFKRVMAQAYDVQIGGNITATVQNLYLAINGTGTAGTTAGGANYYTGTVANVVVYATGLNLTTIPTFQLSALAANITGVVENVLTGVGFVNEAPTVPKAIAVKAQGQFSIQAVQPSAYATGKVTSGGTNPALSSTVTIGAFTYVFKNYPGTPGPYEVFLQGNTDMTLLALAAIINGKQYYTYLGNVFTAGNIGVPNPVATAGDLSGTGAGAYITVTAITVGTAGNSIALARTTSPASHMTVSAATLLGGNSSGIASITIGNVFGSVASTGTIAISNTNVSNGDTVTIGSVTYTFTNAAPPIGTTWAVAIGANTLASLSNLLAAINMTGVQTQTYDIPNIHPQVLAVAALNGNLLQVNSRLGGSVQNNIVLSTTSAVLTVSGATMAGGSDGVSLLSDTAASLPYQTLSAFTTTVTAAINAYSSTSGYYALQTGNTIFLYTNAGNSLSNDAIISVVVSGQVCIGFCGMEFNADSPGGTGTSAQSIAWATDVGDVPLTTMRGYVLNVQVDGFRVTAYKHRLKGDGAGSNVGTVANTVDLTMTDLCADIALDINASSAGVYTAVGVGGALYISRVTTTSLDAPLHVTVVLAQVQGVTDTNLANYMTLSPLGQSGIYAIVSPTSAQFASYYLGQRPVAGKSQAAPTNAKTGPSQAIGFGVPAALFPSLFGDANPQEIVEPYCPTVFICRAFGGYPPYKFQWQWVGGTSGFRVSDETAPSVTFSRQPTTKAPALATWSCLVTDSLGNDVSSNTLQIYQPG